MTLKLFNPPPLGELVDAFAICEALGVSRATLRRMVQDGRFPEPVRLSRRTLRWRVDEVNAWLQSRGRQE